jgi:hypothetical protein
MSSSRRYSSGIFRSSKSIPTIPMLPTDALRRAALVRKYAIDFFCFGDEEILMCPGAGALINEESDLFDLGII